MNKKNIGGGWLIKLNSVNVWLFVGGILTTLVEIYLLLNRVAGKAIQSYINRMLQLRLHSIKVIRGRGSTTFKCVNSNFVCCQL